MEYLGISDCGFEEAQGIESEVRGQNSKFEIKNLKSAILDLLSSDLRSLTSQPLSAQWFHYNLQSKI